MEPLPPQRRPGVFVNLSTGAKDESLTVTVTNKISPPSSGSRGRGKLMDALLTYSRIGSPVGKKTDTLPFQYMPRSSSCQCDREKKHVFCQACGHRFEGRVRTRCPLHPLVIHLMDLEACPNCLATHLKEFGSVTRCS